MKTGTLGFVGSRLRQAREARELSVLALSNLIVKSSTAVYQYENDTHSPRPDVTKKIAEVLQVPEELFRRPLLRQEDGTIFYRCMASALESVRTRAKRRYEWLHEIVAHLRTMVELPPVNIPLFDVPAQPVRFSPEQIEDYAIQTRRFWNMGDGPIGNVLGLLENNGVIVAREEIGADKLDAFSEYCSEDNTPYIFLAADKNIACRARFDIAHELGHLVLHRNMKRGQITLGPEHRLIEEQADRFAGAFLLPEKSFANDLYSATLDAFTINKRKWAVSIAMQIVRAEQLGFISNDQAKRFWMNYSRRQWRKHEPLDDEFEVEKPRLLRLAFELILNDHLQTRKQVLASIPLSSHDIESLAGLPSSYLDNGEDANLPPVKVLQPRRGSKVPDATGQVLKFPEPTQRDRRL
jgi:Zn-dependent peptidase ImmA (M78 family)/transcriptional regulator with XRE-family HTH domain